MKFSKEEQKKIDNLPIMLRLAVKYILEALHNIIYGECSEETLTDTMATLNNNASRRYNDDDLLTYDDACKILHISATNRVKLKRLLDSHGINQVTIHNHKVGFRRSDILSMKMSMTEQSSQERPGCRR